MADPYEEFEFKPLTEGLGFHKKADQLKSETKSTLVRSTIFPDERPKERPKERTDDRSSNQKSDRAATKSFSAQPTFTVQETAHSGSATETTRSAAQSISELMASLPPSLDFLDDKQDLTRRSDMPFGASALSAPAVHSVRPQIFQPLGQGQNTIAQGPTVGSVLPAPGTKAGSTGAASFASLPAAGAMSGAAGVMTGTNSRVGYRERMSETFAKTFPKSDAGAAAAISPTTQGPTAEGLVPVATNFSASLIDAMVVAGISTILLVCLITITHVNLVAMLTNASTDTSTQMNLVFLFFAVLQMYMLVSRAFFGSSLGEWAFDLQLGASAQQRHLSYPLLVMWRTLFITLTGVLAIPLLSFAFSRDLARYVCGVQLYRRV